MLSSKFSWFVLASYLILILIPVLFPHIKNIKLIIFSILLLETILVIVLYLKGKYFSQSQKYIPVFIVGSLSAVQWNDKGSNSRENQIGSLFYVMVFKEKGEVLATCADPCFDWYCRRLADKLLYCLSLQQYYVAPFFCCPNQVY